MKNLLGKTVKQDKPYMIFKAGQWEWRVLKTYKTRESEVKDPYGRWFTAVSSPMTYGSFELGDSYASDIQRQALCTFLSPEAVVAGYTAGSQMAAPSPRSLF